MARAEWGHVMPDDAKTPGLGLAEFLSALREELYEARTNAQGEELKLGVGTVEVALDIGYVREFSGSAEVKARAKFFVFEFGEAGVSTAINTQRSATQHLKLTLNPRMDKQVIGPDGRPTTVSTPVDVAAISGKPNAAASGSSPPAGPPDPEDEPASSLGPGAERG